MYYKNISQCFFGIFGNCCRCAGRLPGVDHADPSRPAGCPSGTARPARGSVGGGRRERAGRDLDVH